MNDPYEGIAVLEKPEQSPAVDPYAGIARLEQPSQAEQAKPDPYAGIAKLEEPATNDPYAGIAKLAEEWPKEPVGKGLTGPIPVSGVSSTPQEVVSTPEETEGIKAYKAEVGKVMDEIQRQPAYMKLITGKALDESDSSFLAKMGKSYMASAWANLPAAGFSYYARHLYDRDLAKADQMTPEERVKSAQDVARAYQWALATEPEKAKDFTGHLANTLGGILGVMIPATAGTTLVSAGAKAVEKVLPAAARTIGQKIVKGAAVGAGAGAVYGAAEAPMVTPEENAGDIAKQKALQTLETTAGFAAFGAGSAAAAHVLPKVFYQQYDWTPERFKTEFPSIVRRVAADQANESEVRLVQDVNAYLEELGQKPGPYARGKEGLDVQVAERRTWVDMIPVLRNIVSGIRKTEIKGGAITTETGVPGVTPGQEGGMKYGQESQRRVEGVQRGGEEPGGPIPEPGGGGEPAAPGGILQTQEIQPGGGGSQEIGKVAGGKGIGEIAPLESGNSPVIVPRNEVQFDVSSPAQPAQRAKGFWAWVDLNDPAVIEGREPIGAIRAGAQDRTRLEREANTAARMNRLTKFYGKWLVDSETADRGAPLFDFSSGRPVAGYGRLETIEDVYSLPADDQRYQDLQQTYSEKAQELGLGPAPEDMERPFLARFITGYENSSPRQFAAESNVRVAQAYSPAEKSLRDANIILRNNLLSTLNIPESGDILALDNMPFVSKFIEMSGDAAELVNERGEPLPEAANRIQKALFTALLSQEKTYEPAVISAMVERAQEYGMTDMVKGLSAEAPDLIEIKINRPNFDISPLLAKVMPTILRIRQDIISKHITRPADYFKQHDFLLKNTPEEEALSLVLLDARSAKEIREILAEYKRLAMKMDTTTQDMFAGQIAESNLTDLLKKARQNYEEQRIPEYIKRQRTGGGTAGKIAGRPADGRQVQPARRPAPLGAPETAGKEGERVSNIPPEGGEEVKSDIQKLKELLSGQAQTHSPELIPIESGKTVFREMLENVAASKRGALVNQTPEVLATRSLQSKAIALLEALNANRITEADAKTRYDKFAEEVERGMKVVIKQAENLKAGPEQRQLFKGEGLLGRPAGKGAVATQEQRFEPEHENKILEAATKVMETYAREKGIKEISGEDLTSALSADFGNKIEHLYPLIKERTNALLSGAGNIVTEKPTETPPAGPEKPIETMPQVGEARKKGLPPEDDPEYSRFPIELPEMVQMAKALIGGKYPTVKRKMRMLGGFRYSPVEQDILIRADQFDVVSPEEKKNLLQEAKMQAKMEFIGENIKADELAAATQKQYEMMLDQVRNERKGMPPMFALRVLAHEIGHAVDYQPLKEVTGRGNIFAHIASLREFLKKTFPMKPGSDMGISKEMRNILKQKADKEARRDPGMSKEVYKRLIAQEIKTRGLVGLKEIKAELTGLINWYNNWPGPELPDYYAKQPEEMYAEALSVILNNPAAVEKRAPKFYAMFFDYLERKPEYKAIYDKLMDDIKSGQIYKDRVIRLRKELSEANTIAQAWTEAAHRRTSREIKDEIRFDIDRMQGPVEQRVIKVPDETLKGDALDSLDRFLYKNAMEQAYVMDTENKVMKPLTAAGLTMNDLDEYMMHLRNIFDNPWVAHPGGFDPKASAERLTEMREQFGERFNVLEDLAKQNRQIYEENVLGRLRDYKIFSEDQIAEMEKRKAYVTYHIQKDAPVDDPIQDMFNAAFGKSITAKISKQVGSFSPTKSPFTATLQKGLKLIDFAEREKMKWDVLNAIMSPDSPFKDEIQPAKRYWNGRYLDWVEPKIKRVGVITVMHDGELFVFYAPQVLADSINYDNPLEMRPTFQLIHLINNALKVMYTTGRPDIWPRLWARDIKEFNRKIPGAATDWRTYVPIVGGAYWRNFLPAWKAATSIYKGTPNKLGMEALQKGLVISHREGYMGSGIRPNQPLPEYSGEYMQIVRGFGYFSAAERKENIKLLDRFFERFLSIGQIFENTSKINGWLYLQQRFPNNPEWKNRIAVHTWAGSPNFLAKGAYNPLIDSVRLYYNPWKEGLRTESWAWAGGGGWKSRWSEMLFTTARSMLGRVAFWYLVGGGVVKLFEKFMGHTLQRSDYAQMYEDGPSDNDKRGYTPIPLGWYDKQERKVWYLILPAGEGERIINAVTETLLGLELAKLGDPDTIANAMTDVLGYMNGQLPGINPATKLLLYDLPLFVTGGNPYDFYRKQYALTDNEAAASKKTRSIAFAKYVFNNLLGSVAFRFDQPRFDEPPRGMVERVINSVPGMNKWIRISNAGYRERLRKSTMPFQEQKAEIAIAVEKIVANYKREGKLTEAEILPLIQGQIVDQQLEKIQGTPELELQRYYWTHFKSSAEKIGISMAPIEARMLLGQKTKVGRAALLGEMIKEKLSK